MATTKQAAAPGLMNAVRIAQYGGSEQLRYEEVLLPRIVRDHVLAKVHYAGVNPVDRKIREGDMEQVFPVSFPLTVGHDFAGEIAKPAAIRAVSGLVSESSDSARGCMLNSLR